MSLRFKMMIAPGIGAAFLMVAAVAQITGHPFPSAWLIIVGLLSLGLALFAVERWIRRPLLQLAHGLLQQPEMHRINNADPQMDGAFVVLQRAIDKVVVMQREGNAALRYEKTLRQQTQSVLRESEERHALALRCVNDGWWEWDLKAGVVHYSVTWKAALGYGDDDIGEGVREWHDRIHPDDCANALAKLDKHIAGETAFFECDHRLRHRDGSYRWFLARGRALHSASGRAYKMIGVNSDIGARKRAEEILLGIATGMAVVSGDNFFRDIVKSFAETLRVKYAFITQCVDRPPTRVRMLAAWMDGEYDELLEYDLSETPCDITIRHNTVNLIPVGLEALYPIDVGFESYFGIPICNSAGAVIGHLACLDVKPMDQGLPTLPIFTLFALRAGMEMESRLLLREYSSAN